MEDLTDPELLRTDPKTDRKISLYGYIRGTNLKADSDVHIPGVGDFRVYDVSILADPCPLPSAIKKRSLNQKERLIYAPFSGVGGIIYDKDSVYVNIVGREKRGGGRGAGLEGEEQEPGREMIEALAQSKVTLDENLEDAELRLFKESTPMLNAEVGKGGAGNVRRPWLETAKGEVEVEEGEGEDEEDDDESEEEDEDEMEVDDVESGSDDDEEEVVDIVNGGRKPKLTIATDDLESEGDEEDEDEEEEKWETDESKDDGQKKKLPQVDGQNDETDSDEEEEEEEEEEGDDDSDEKEEDDDEDEKEDGRKEGGRSKIMETDGEVGESSDDDDDDDDDDDENNQSDLKDSKNPKTLNGPEESSEEEEMEEGEEEEDEVGTLKWKENLAEKAENNFLKRRNSRRNWKRLVYGVDASETGMETPENADNKVGGGLFTIRAAHQAQKDAKDSQRLANSLDTSRRLKADADAEGAANASSTSKRDWMDPEVLKLIVNCFVTGDWGAEDAKKRLARDKEAGEEEDEELGAFEDLQTGETEADHKGEKGDGDDDAAEGDEGKEGGNQTDKQKRIEKKRKLKEMFDLQYDNKDTDGKHYEELRVAAEAQSTLNRQEFAKLDDDARTSLEGFWPGLYVRIG